MAHPLWTPRRGTLNPPTNELNLKGWKQYYATATGWLSDLEQYAANEQRHHGEVSAETNELLDEARETITWSKSKLDIAEMAESDPERYFDWRVLKEQTDYALHKAQWRKSFARHPEWTKGGTFTKSGALQPSRGSITDRVWADLAREQNDVMAFLDADHRSKEEIIADAEFEAILIDAEHDGRAAQEFDALCFEGMFE